MLITMDHHDHGQWTWTLALAGPSANRRIHGSVRFWWRRNPGPREGRWCPASNWKSDLEAEVFCFLELHRYCDTPNPKCGQYQKLVALAALSSFSLLITWAPSDTKPVDSLLTHTSSSSKLANCYAISELQRRGCGGPRTHSPLLQATKIYIHSRLVSAILH